MLNQRYTNHNWGALHTRMLHKRGSAALPLAAGRENIIALIALNKLINSLHFSPVSFQRKPLERLQIQNPETSMKKRSAPVETLTLDL